VDLALDSIDKTVNHVDGLVNGARPDINQIAKNGVQITGKINTLLTDLNAGKGAPGMLLKDEQLSSSFRLRSPMSNKLRQT
jgi:hypothetical protein